MQNSLFRKGLVFVILVLFVVINTTSLTGNLSTEKPQTDCSLIGTSEISLITIKVVGEIRNGWYIKDVHFIITSESNEIAEIYYNIDGVPYKYTKPFNITEDGDDILFEWYAVNYSGNQSKVNSFTLDIDQTKPLIDVRWDAYQIDGEWYIKFTVNATDAMSGMERIKMYINEGFYEEVIGPGPVYEFNIKWSDDYKYCVFKFVAFDIAGHSDYDIIRIWFPDGLESSKFLKDNIEKDNQQNSQNSISKKEIVEREKSQSGHYISDEFNPSYIIVFFDRKMGNNDWIVNDVNLSIIHDPIGVESVYYSVDDGEWTLYNGFLVVSEDGEHRFSWYIIDIEGYSSTPNFIFFKIDQTPPEINLIKKRKALDEVKLIADVYDETSNIERVEFYEGSYLRFTDYDFPYEWTLNEWRNVKVTAKVYDNAGNSNSSSMYTWHSYSQNINKLWLFDRFSLFQRVLDIFR